MLHILTIVLIFVTAFLAAVLSTMSGGGSGLITTPVWLMLGYPLPMAIASNNISGAGWTLVAARTYLKGHTIDWPLLAGLLAFGLLGAYGGTHVMESGNPKVLQRVIGCIILSLAAFTYFRRDFGIARSSPRAPRWLTSLAGLPLGFYEAFFGAGNGIITSALLTFARGLELLKALGYYYVLACLWCTFAATLYIKAGNWNATLMIPSALGSLGGAALGSRIGRRQGALFVKRLFVCVGGVLGLKLALGL